MSQVIISEIFIYPVKSLSGISVPAWTVSETGLQYDRKWMIIDDAGQFLSQRVLPRMTLIKTALTDKSLILSAPGMENLALPLEPVDGQIIASTIWHDCCDARSVSQEADQWLSGFLSKSCRMVYQPSEMIRQVNLQYANAGDKVAFSDGFPFLIISENSLASLNRAMRLNLPMIRFRPNLVISGCDAYAEDCWREISIGAIDFRFPKPCSRCSVPTIDPETAQTGKEPLRTLNRIRKWNNKVYFGQNALHNQVGRLTLGDQVRVKLTGPNQPPL
ncbi:conserved hypothetical protein [Candidatus Methylobacter favarea]|uniref:MOSC domain-containing protein n=1 Tax=Candidatus Methylobacter favarea TaxID=2707345 RepID=A0A8S0WAF5_9GAMM|nr:MOSC N-terminal beta barrel domain-containing protein [Candidatus Methylobacter favarea]CAA9890699.1 conserved hypothetical protein [Candidatus Methylobacter favarea]